MRQIDARRLTPAQRRRILERDSGICLYCSGEADQVDHIVPWCYRHDDSDANLAAACQLCNLIASDKMFQTGQDKKDFILARRYEMIEKKVIPIWTRVELNRMGRGMRDSIELNCLVVETSEEAAAVAFRLRKEGLRVNVQE